MSQLIIPKVSILIPVYKVEKYVKRCILSVLSQSMQDGVEVLIVNDCTPDRSMDIVREVIDEYGRQSKMTFRIINHEKNMGLSMARKTLLDNAKGEFTIFVDSDDTIDPRMIEEMYEAAVSEQADIVVCDIQLKYPNKMKIIHYVKPWHSVDSVTYSLCNKLVRKNLYIDNQIQPDQISMWEDVVVTFRLFFVSRKTIGISKAYYCYFVDENENSICKKINKKSIDDQFRCVQVLEEFINKHGQQKIGKKLLIQMKIHAKRMLLLRPEVRDLSLWRKTYSDCNKYICGIADLPIYERVACIFVIFRLGVIAIFIINMVTFLKYRCPCKF